jgi:hypothetical protein
MKNVGKILKWTGVVILAILVLLPAINAVDERLAPEVAELGSVPAPIPPGENAYFAIFGFQAPSGEDMHARGVEMVAEYEKIIQADPTSQAVLFPVAMLGEKRLQLVGGGKDLCHSAPDPYRCLAYYLRRSAETTRILADNTLMLDRYVQLIAYPHFQETLPPVTATAFNITSPIRTAHQLFLAKIAMHVKNGKTSAALAMIRQDTVFLRRMAAEGNALLGKLVAFSLLSADIRALSEIISLQKLTPADIVMANNIVQPLTDQERSLARVCQFEARYVRNLVSTMARDGNASILQGLSEPTKSGEPGVVSRVGQFFFRLFFKPNATFNIAGRTFIDVMALDAMKGPDYSARLKERRGLTVERDRSRIRLDMVYNPVGKFYIDAAVQVLYGYSRRGHDLDGLMRLVALKVLVKQKAVPDSQVEHLLGTAGPRYADPYASRPMQWDGKKRCIYFNGMNESFELKQRVEVLL